ncbi:MAG: SPOR domain-containing protein [Prevotella sp.]|nr:SPOR domain-containing protein [Prevotella sp.]
MIELEKHIEILLLSNDCVIVPNFGGFMAHHAEARYEEQEQLFLPPLRTLGFNPQLQLNDSLLAQSYIEAYDISYPEAIKRIADEVHEMKQRLSEDGSYELNDIGRIFLNDEGRYEFLPCEAGILSPELYGLSSFEMSPLAAIKLKQATVEKESIKVAADVKGTTPEIVLVDEEQDDEKAEIVTLADEDENEENAKTISIKVSVLRNLAAACIAAVAFMLFPSQLNNTTSKPNAGSAINTEMLMRVMPKSITTQGNELLKVEAPVQEKTVDNQSQNDDATVANTKQMEQKAPVAEPEVKKPQTSYTIVLASQVGQKNAEIFVGQLKKKGYNGARIIKTGKTIRVVCNNYTTENEAYNALRPLRQSDSDFAEGWVMKISN